MTKILFVVAEMQEAEQLIKHYQLHKRIYNSIDLWSNNDFYLIVTGAGVNNIISSLSMAMHLGVLIPARPVINIGYAGAKGINVGQVVCVKNCHCLEFPVKANTNVENCVRISNEGYNCYTSFDFVEKAETTEQTLFDMELAYIARFVFGKLHSIKIVSDNLDYDGFKEFNGDKAWEEVFEKIEKIRKEEFNVSGNITA